MLGIKNPQGFFLIRKKLFKKLNRHDYLVGFYDGYFYKLENDQKIQTHAIQQLIQMLTSAFKTTFGNGEKND